MLRVFVCVCMWFHLIRWNSLQSPWKQLQFVLCLIPFFKWSLLEQTEWKNDIEATFCTAIVREFVFFILLLSKKIHLQSNKDSSHILYANTSKVHDNDKPKIRASARAHSFIESHNEKRLLLFLLLGQKKRNKFLNLNLKITHVFITNYSWAHIICGLLAFR